MLDCVDAPALRPTAHRLTVLATGALSPTMRRVTVAAPTLAVPGLRPAQDVGLMLTDAARRPVRRRYTLSSVDVDAGTLDLDGVLHGSGPGAAWFAAARPGMQVDAFGPRSGVDVTAADWYLMASDESGFPAVAELRARVSAQPVVALFEVGSADEELAEPQAQWLHRNGRESGLPDGFATALSSLTVPAGNGYAYVLGESRAVTALKPVLAALGLGPERCHVKGYWNRPRS